MTWKLYTDLQKSALMEEHWGIEWVSISHFPQKEILHQTPPPSIMCMHSPEHASVSALGGGIQENSDVGLREVHDDCLLDDG